MHIHFEQNTYTRTDSNFHSLSWMGKAPDSLPEDSGDWDVNRAHYYMEGWLASGNGKGVVGITFTTSHCRKYEAPPRSNFNLRGHRSEVILVKWNEPYQRLATCDSRGVIFLWIKHEGRWSIELINDRNSQVTDFAWSHDGRMALICYRDGFVLVGSVFGQRYWSSMLNLDNTAITCGIWSPDDQQVMFGTTDGQVIVMSSTGAMQSQVTINEGFEITSMAWSCVKFNMEETADNAYNGNYNKSEGRNSDHVLAVCFKYGDIFLMSSYDDVCPRTVYTTLTGLKMDWSNCGEYLAVGGFMRLPNLQCRSEVHFYSREGKRIHWVNVPSQGKPLTALTWGHNDKRLFLAAGCQLYVAWVSKQVAPLHFLCQRVIHKCVRHEKNVEQLPLPQRLRQGVQSLFSPTVKSYIPDPFKLRGFVSTPPPGNERLFCTMIRHGDETSGGHYTLYLEYLGGLVPLLKGKRASKLRPDFVIFDPKIRTSSKGQNESGNTLQTDSSSESDTDVVTDGCGSPRMQRRRRQKVFRPEKVDRSITFRTLDELLYNDNLPESNKLVEVTSNIWGTKFQITGVASYLPSILGQIVYKTSLLHLQPRQMTITLQEICGSSQPLARDPNFTPAGASDDDDSSWPGDDSTDTLQETPASMFPADTPYDASPSQVCCVDVQSPGTLMGTPVHSSHSPECDTASVYVSGSDNGGSNGGSGGGGNGGVTPAAQTLSSKLTHTGSIRSRSLSPVQDSNNQTTTLAFNGDVNVNVSVNVHANKDIHASKDIYIAQGARPKTKKHLQPKRPSSVKDIPNQSATFTSSVAASVVTAEPIGPAVSTEPATVFTDTNPTTTTSAVSDIAEVSIVPGAMLCSPVSPEPEVASMLKRVPGSGSGGGDGPRWADPASQAIKFIDEDASDASELPFENNLVADCSPLAAPSNVSLQRRLYLTPQEESEEKSATVSDKSHSHDSSPVSENNSLQIPLETGVSASSDSPSPVDETRTDSLLFHSLAKDQPRSGTASSSVLSNGIGGSDIEILQSASLPSSPIHRAARMDIPAKRLREGKCRHLSPVFLRKGKHSADNVEEDLLLTVMDDFKGGQTYYNLETFQKAQLKHKLRRAAGSCGRQFVMHNKAPLWNENSQVYQLDFNGRVTQESAKNFQIELQGKQVMQFGRIDSNAYTLDFQYPFTALQAFAVALANVTQRLK